jgi:glycosyltransferase involved in cell wall biosynthesis
MKKLLFIQNLVYPIRTPFFDLLKKSRDIEVVYLSDTASNRKWKINQNSLKHPHKILSNFRIPTPIPALEIVCNPFSLFEYFSFKYDYLISIGWANPTNYLYILLSYIRNKPYYLWVESTLNENSLQRKIMFPVIKLLVKNAKACIVPGTASQEYVESYFSRVKTIVIPNAIENDKFKNKNKDIKKNKIPILLYVGRFSPEKNILRLLKSIKELEINYKFKLWLIGYGKQEEEIREYIKVHEIKSVDKIEYVNKEELHNIYNKSDLLILPSTQEPWGFVINEAMASGLAIISSNKVGSSFDLVHSGENGYTFNPYDHNELSKKISILLSDKIKLKIMGGNSIEIIKSITINNMIKKINENI